jgi:predicted P-loop ATPase
MPRKKNIDLQITSPLQQLMDWLFAMYDFKRDLVKEKIHFKNKEDKEYKELNDASLNTISMKRELASHKKCSPADVERILMSDFNPGNHDPLREYFDKVSKKNPKGAIDKLAKIVTTTNQEMFTRYLKKWFVASVANYYTAVGCQNQMCLTLVGGQGLGKTTFFNHFLPKDLLEYMYTGNIDLDDKGTPFKLSEYFIINIEEQLKGLYGKDENKLKTLITLPNVKGRRPYGRIEASNKRIGNFLASTNNDDFISDASGSRRFPSFRVTAVNLNDIKKINIDDVWSEALHIYRSGSFEYWVTAADQIELEKSNKEFIHLTYEHDQVALFFSPTDEKNEGTHIVPTAVIKDFIAAETGTKNVRDRCIGTALKQLGFTQVSHRFPFMAFPIKAWKVIINNPTGNAVINKYTI